MGDPHNPDRYGETWPQYKIDACLAALQPLKNLVVLSGGWAWHFMAPKGHTEYKQYVRTDFKRNVFCIERSDLGLEPVNL